MSEPGYSPVRAGETDGECGGPPPVDTDTLLTEPRPDTMEMKTTSAHQSTGYQGYSGYTHTEDGEVIGGRTLNCFSIPSLQRITLQLVFLKRFKPSLYAYACREKMFSRPIA